MRLDRLSVETEHGPVPAVMLAPPEVRGGAVVLHGYGGNKEEVLGLASRIASLGLMTCAIDLRGHGENDRPLDGDVLREVEAVVAPMRRFGKVVAVGHSLGGRLALASSAELVFAISPALSREYGPVTRKALDELRSYRVREARAGVVFDFLRSLPEWHPDGRATAIVFGSRDGPEIAGECRRWMAVGAPVTEIPLGLHADTIVLERTFEVLQEKLRGWF